MFTKSMQALFITFLSILIMFVQAQYTNPYTGYTWNNMISATLDTTIMNNMQSMQLTSMLTSNMLGAQMLADQAIEKSIQPQLETSINPTTLELETAITSFTPVSGRLVPPLLAQAFASSPDEQAFFEELLYNGLAFFENRASEFGGEVYDVERAFSFLVNASYSIYYDNYDGLGQAEYNAVRQNLHGFFSSSPDFLLLTDQDKQVLYEFAASLGGLLLIGTDLMVQHNETEGLAIFREVAGGVLEGLVGVKPEHIDFTATGIIINP